MNSKPIIVKIAVKMESENTQFIEFNKNEDLRIIIEDLCCKWGIINVDQYSLKLESNNNYVTEENRTEIKNGDVLFLTFSPLKETCDIIEALKSFSGRPTFRNEKKKSYLQNLSEICIDKTFSLAFIHENGLDLLIDFIEKNKDQEPLVLVNALDSFIKIMGHKIVSWDILEPPFIKKIASFVSSSKMQEVKIIQYSLTILESIVLNCNDKYDLIEKTVGFPKRLIQRLESDNIKQYALSLINAFFFKADSNKQRNIADALFSKDNLYIFQNIINLSEVKLEIAHHLYVTQTLYLNLLAERMNTKIDSQGQDQNVIEKFKKLREIEFDLDPIGGGDPNGRNFGPFVIDNKLGFTDEKNPALDFTNTPPGMLAFDCIVYFANNHKEEYAKVIFENSCRTDKRECPFGRSSVEIVRVLCKQFKIGVPPSEHKTKFFQILFSHTYPFYELYRVCITYMSRTWREMRATAGDFDKVLNFVMVQVNSVLNSKPELTNFEKLSQKLSSQMYSELNNQKQLEELNNEKRMSHFLAEKKIVETVRPELIQLIKKQRLNYMAEGTRFIKIEPSGQEKNWFIKLSKNHTYFRCGDWDNESTLEKEKLKNIIRVSEIKSLNISKDQPQIAKGRKPQLLLSLTVVSLETKEEESFCFIAPNEKSYDYWIDGINALLENEMTSKEAEYDLDRLLSMEIQIRILEDE